MNLMEKIESHLSKAIKSRDILRAETLKMLKSDITYEKAKKEEDLTDDQILEIVSRAGKRRKESIKEFQRGNRNDLAEKEAAELKIIEEYLPEQMGEDEIEKIITRTMDELGEVTQKDFGKIMGAAMKELKGKADGSIVKRILNKKLESE
ncbi:GatB/YqeY domain-containing protein [Spirochaetota bacterium]